MALTGHGNRSDLLITAASASAQLCAAEDSNRKVFFIQNNDASNPMYLGPSGVTTSAYQVKVAAGGSHTDKTTRAAWYVIAGGAISISGYTGT